MISQKRDANEAEIIDALRAAGAGVQQMDRMDGHDLTVFFRGRVYIVEVKNPARKWKLTAAENDLLRLCDLHGVRYRILETVADALNMIGVL